MNLTEQLQQILDTALARLPEAGLTLVVGLVVVEGLLFILSKLLQLSRMRDGLRRIIKSLLRTFLFIVLLVAVLQSLGLNNVFVALGGSSVILALFLSTGIAPLVTDVVAGLFLGGDREFQPGATVKAGDKGAEGEVVHMDIRKTYIKDRGGKVHVIPNSLIEKNEWVILKKSGAAAPAGSRKRPKL